MTEDDNATQYLAERLPTFTTFIKEMVLFFDIMHAKGKLDDVQIGEAVYEELHNGAAQSVPTIRVWLLEMYVRGCLEINNKKLNAIEGDDTPTNRQVYMTECARPWYGSLSSQNQRSLPSVPWMLFIG